MKPILKSVLIAAAVTGAFLLVAALIPGHPPAPPQFPVLPPEGGGVVWGQPV